MSKVHNRGGHMENAKYRTGVDWVGLGAMLLLVLCSIVFFIQLMALNMLTTVLSFVAMIVLIVINGAHIFVQMPLRNNKLGKIICSVLAFILSAGMIYGSVAIGNVQEAINKISGNTTQVDVIAIMVTKKSGIKDLEELNGKDFGMMNISSDRSIEAMDADEVVDAIGVVSPDKYDSVYDLADALLNDKIDAIVLNESYLSVLEGNDSYADFSSQTRIIFEYKLENEINYESSVNVTRDCFVVYLSGIDARDGNVTMKSRSDVNILAVVNPVTHQVALINTPRDYYLPLDFNGEMDKLTHAGMYGIEESMAILGTLYDIDVSFYVRVNFNGLIDIVDAVDGIDVNSDYNFTSIAMDIPGYDQGVSYSFTKGTNHLNGIQALVFSRERKSFPLGDVQRGINQMAVIKGIISKATSPSILKNYDELLDAVGDNVVTNMSNNDISKLVQAQLKNNEDWNIVSYTVSGSGDTCDTYTAGYAWVMWPDDDMVDNAKGMIEQVVNGETVTSPED